MDRITSRAGVPHPLPKFRRLPVFSKSDANPSRDVVTSKKNGAPGFIRGVGLSPVLYLYFKGRLFARLVTYRLLSIYLSSVILYGAIVSGPGTSEHGLLLFVLSPFVSLNSPYQRQRGKSRARTPTTPTLNPTLPPQADLDRPEPRT